MKKITYLFGLMAMVVMMTMTACSGVNSDVKKVCDVLDEATEKIEAASNMNEIQAAMTEIQNSDEEVDESVELTADDKAALKDSFMGACNAMVDKMVELYPELSAQENIEDVKAQMESRVDEIIENSKTLGDFAKKVSRF